MDRTNTMARFDEHEPEPRDNNGFTARELAREEAAEHKADIERDES